MRYEDFVIRIGPQIGEAYHVRVERSPAGEGKSTLHLPFDMSEVGRMLGGLARTVRGAAGPDVVDPPTREVGEMVGEQAPPGPKEVGKQLYDALFHGEVQERFLSSVGVLQGRNQGLSGSKRFGLRIRLKMDLDESGLAEVASLPWEFLYPGAEKGFLNTSESTPVIRALDVGQPTQPYPFQPPLRILVVIANPQGSAELDLTEEREAIERSWGNLEEVEVDFLEKATIQDLRQQLGSKDYHVFHFMGHGDFDRDTNQGVLLFDDGTGSVQAVSSDTLQMMLRDESLRLVFLNACKTAVTGHQDDVDPFAGVATSLIRVGIPALVAMQFPISDPAAIVFSKTFYQRIVEGAPVDIAMVEARKAITAQDVTTMEWATPVLFMRSPDGVLFKRTALAYQAGGTTTTMPKIDVPKPDPPVQKKPGGTHEDAGRDEQPTDATDTQRGKDPTRDVVTPTPGPTKPTSETAVRPTRNVRVLAGGGAVAVLGVAAAIAFWPRTPTPTALSFESAPLEMEQGGSVPLVLSLRAENGDDIDDPGHLASYEVDWEAAPGALASLVPQVDSARSRLVGVLTAGRPGTVTVTASLGEALRDVHQIEITRSADSLAQALIERGRADVAFNDPGASDEEVRDMYSAIAARFDYTLTEEGMGGVRERVTALDGLVSTMAEAGSAATAEGLTLHERRSQLNGLITQASNVRSTSPAIAEAQQQLEDIDAVGGSYATLQSSPQLGICRAGLCATSAVPDAVLDESNPMSPGHVSVAARFATRGTVTWRLMKDGREIGTHSIPVPGGNERRNVSTSDSSEYASGPLSEAGTYEIRLHNGNGGQLGDVIGRVVFCITSCS